MIDLRSSIFGKTERKSSWKVTKLKMGILRDLDLFDKFVNTDYATSTFGGRFFSMLFSVFGLVFITAEIAQYSKPIIYSDLLYSPHLETENRVNFTFSIQVGQPCYYLHLDVLDNLGRNVLNIKKGATFKRMSQSDSYIGEANDSVQNICFPCHDFVPGKNCCFCSDIINRMQELGMSIRDNSDFIKKYPQCTGDIELKVDETETCIIDATLPLYKTTTEFHIGTGRNLGIVKGQHTHDLSLGLINKMTHTIHDFYIDQRRNNTISPLRGKMYNKAAPFIFMYDIKTTPVITTHNGKLIDSSYEYSLTEGHLTYHGSISKDPGIYFNVHFSPMTVAHRIVTKNMMRLIVSSAGVLAGAFALITALNGLLSKFCSLDGPKMPIAFK